MNTTKRLIEQLEKLTNKKVILKEGDDEKIKDIAVEANTNIGKYVQNKPTGKKDKYANNIYEYEATNPFTNEKVVFKKKADAVDYVIKEVAKATTKSGREEIFNKQNEVKNPMPKRFV